MNYYLFTGGKRLDRLTAGLTPRTETRQLFGAAPRHIIDVKNVLRFLFWSRFLRFFYFPNVFHLKKRWQSSEHLQEFEVQWVHKSQNTVFSN